MEQIYPTEMVPREQYYIEYRLHFDDVPHKKKIGIFRWSFGSRNTDAIFSDIININNKNKYTNNKIFYGMLINFIKENNFV